MKSLISLLISMHFSSVAMAQTTISSVLDANRSGVQDTEKTCVVWPMKNKDLSKGHSVLMALDGLGIGGVDYPNDSMYSWTLESEQITVRDSKTNELTFEISFDPKTLAFTKFTANSIVCDHLVPGVPLKVRAFYVGMGILNLIQ